MSQLTHIGADGAARMVDVSAKTVTLREAQAKGRVVMRPETVSLIRDNQAEKGDVLAAARIAGIMAAKKTGELIPLCHPLPLDAISIDLILEQDSVEIVATARTTARTGIEMEALTAVSLAALTIYDMVKAADKTMRIEAIRLTRKTGGKSGDFSAP
ncbi:MULTISPECIES: cyclic pyranopterin monophosphate synthase MoaC [unclassified Acidocella]|uniref:cyclic pyranopterin monophosphate synthase MoaC n=1 Tax=unclassified Acidocella TaxID=2648610 RepID=UPI00028EE9F1|nr:MULTISPECIES: cyclic pyranopterin monophosphate synthase MoaC [unclassified Acidocella]EKM99164.1 molybdenum cofactor biosynthesis protein C [Acidocella sp. MX-AZ02]WBO57890.1 cyclic pyranopterin monophosphate synthase MoaC [Acidocella sp. MX-AZ03]